MEQEIFSLRWCHNLRLLQTLCVLALTQRLIKDWSLSRALVTVLLAVWQRCGSRNMKRFRIWYEIWILRVVFPKLETSGTYCWALQEAALYTPSWHTIPFFIWWSVIGIVKSPYACVYVFRHCNMHLGTHGLYQSWLGPQLALIRKH